MEMKEFGMLRGWQKPLEGFYNLEKMLADLVKVGVCVNVCHTSMNLKGLIEQDLVEGTKMGTITGLSKWTTKSQKVLSFQDGRLRCLVFSDFFSDLEEVSVFAYPFEQ